LLLAARQLARIALRQRRELGGRQNSVQFLSDGRSIHFPKFQAVDDVLRYRHVRPERIALEDHRHISLLGRQGVRRRGNQLVADADFARTWFDEAGDQPQCRCFTAAGRPQKTD
jgi:hypothetical protein